MTTKAIILLLFINIPTILFGQLKGEFCHGFGFGVECITFLDSNKFEYSHIHCTGHNKGIGVYTLVGNKLTLQFETDTTNNTKYNVSIQKAPTNSDTITVEVNFFSMRDNEPLYGENSFVTDVTGRVIYRKTTDFDGHCAFKIPTILVSPVLTIQASSNSSYSYNISLDNNYKINISVKDDFVTHYDSTKTITFTIKDIKKRKVSLKSDYLEAIFSTYEKR